MFEIGAAVEVQPAGASAGPEDSAPGDQTAQPLSLDDFLAIVQECERDLLGFLRRMARDPELARDLAQDTFYDAWRATKRGAPPFIAGRPPDERRRWLFHAAYCRAISALRKHGRIAWQPLDADEEPLPAALVLRSFEDQVAEHDALHTALATLSPEDAACLTLIVTQGYTAAETAAMLDATPQAMAKRLSRAKRRLLTAYLAPDPTHAHNA